MKKIVTTLYSMLIILSLFTASLVVNAETRLYAGTDISPGYGIRATITAPSYKEDFGNGGAAWVGMDRADTWQALQTGFYYTPARYNFITYYEIYNGGAHSTVDVGLHLFGYPIDYRVELNASAAQWEAYISNTLVGTLEYGGAANVSALAEFFSNDKKLLPIKFENVSYRYPNTGWRYMDKAPNYNDSPYIATYSGAIYCNYTIEGR